MKKLFATVLVLIMVLSICSMGVVAQAETTSFRFGQYDGKDYYNESMNIGYKLPDGFEYATMDEILEKNDLANMKNDLATANIIAGASALDYDLRVVNPNTGCNIQMLVQNKMRISDENFTEEVYVEELMKELPGILQEAGMSGSRIERFDTNFCGDDHLAISAEGKLKIENELYDFYEVLFIIKINENYIVDITIAGFDLDEMVVAMNGFYRYE